MSGTDPAACGTLQASTAVSTGRLCPCQICDGSGLARPDPQPGRGAAVEDRVGSSQSDRIEQARASGSVQMGMEGGRQPGPGEWWVRLEGDLEGPAALTDPSSDSDSDPDSDQRSLDLGSGSALSQRVVCVAGFLNPHPVPVPTEACWVLTVPRGVSGRCLWPLPPLQVGLTPGGQADRDSSGFRA
eukprot:1113355-Rhodomonas_salina.1